MVNVYIKDSGRIAIPYNVSETQFPLFSAATQTEKRAGEFRIDDTVTLKVEAANFVVNGTSQTVGGASDLRSIIQETGMDAIGLNLTCTLNKPRNTFTNVTDKKDLTIIPQLLKMKIGRGYKQLWISDVTDTDRETLFSLYYFITLFGLNDGSLTEGTTDVDDSDLKKHIKLLLKSFNHQEGVDNATYNLSFDVIWDI